MAESPYLYYKELASSGHIVSAEFFCSFNRYSHSKEEFLCTLTSDLISIFKVVNNQDTKLHLVYNERLFGTARDVKSFRRGDVENDLLFVALDLGKLISFEYNLHESQIELRSLCNIEENAIGLGAELKCSANGKKTLLGSGENPILRVDQSNRLVCMLAYGEFLFICSIDEDFENLQEKELLATSSRFLVHTHTHAHLLGPILDICFVSGYSRPVIAILQQERFVPLGHLAKSSSTCTLSVLAVDDLNKKLCLLYKHSKLPHDCCSLAPLSGLNSYGMVLVVSRNALLAANSEYVTALPMNAFAAVSVKQDLIPFLPHQSINFPHRLGPDFASRGLDLKGSRWIQVQKSSSAHNVTIIGVIESNEVIQIDIYWTSREEFKSIFMEGECLLNVNVPQACYLALSRDSSLLFLASKQTKSVLFTLQAEVAESFQINDYAAYISDRDDLIKSVIGEDYLFLSANKLKQLKREEDDPLAIVEANQKLEDLINLDLDMYGKDKEESKLEVAVQRLSLKEVDSLPCLGSISQALFTKNDDPYLPLMHRITYQTHLASDGEQVSAEWISLPEHEGGTDDVSLLNKFTTPASYIVEREAKDCLYLCHGKTLTRVYNGIPCTKVASRHFPGALRCLTVSGLTCPYGLMIVSYESRSRILYYMNVLHKVNEMLFQESSPESKEFVTTASTVYVGLLYTSEAGEQVVVQVTTLGVRVVKLQNSVQVEDYISLQKMQHDPLQDMLLSDSVETGGLGGILEESITIADCIEGFFVVLTSLHNMFLLQYNKEDEFLEVRYSIMHESSTHKNKHHVFESSSGLDLNRLQSNLSTQILYSSLFLAPINAWKMPEKAKKQVTLSKAQQEELAMYGRILDDADHANGVSCEEVDPGRDFSTIESSSPAQDIPSIPYLLITDREGYLSIINIHSLELVLYCSIFSSSSKIRYISTSVSNCEDLSPDKQEHEERDYMVEAKLFTMSIDSSAGCLAIQYHTGEVRLYTVSMIQNTVIGFQLKHSQLLHNHRPVQAKKSRGLSSFEATAQDDYLDSEDFVNRIPTTMIYVSNISPDLPEAVFLSGSDPSLLAIHRGMPVLSTIDLPETPYINYGHHLLFPLQCSYTYDRGSKTMLHENLAFFSTLWSEYDDLDLVRNPTLAKMKSTKPATLGIYRFLSNFVLDITGNNSQGVAVAYCNIENKDPIMKLLEFNRMLSDSKTEQALLNKKTYLMVTCPQNIDEFPVNTGAASPEDMETLLLERYFPDLTSFCDPILKSSSIPLPPGLTKEYVLNLVQNGVIVDSHKLPKSDQLLDAIIFYAPVEHMSPVIAPSTRHSGRQQTVMQVSSVEKRIMVLISTVDKDLRGEDSQCFGKLLLFSLDYAMFDEEDEVEDEKKEESKTEVQGDKEMDVEEKDHVESSDAKLDEKNGENKMIDNTMENNNAGDTNSHLVKNEDKVADGDSMDVAIDDSKPANGHRSASNGHSKANSASGANFFDNIQPKLRLVWSGSGPASVLCQMSFCTGLTNTANNATIQAYCNAYASTSSPIIYSNYVVATVQSTLYVYKFRADTLEMEQVAFFFSQNYISSVRVFKNYILVTDVLFSVQLLFFREEDNSIHLVAKDFNRRMCKDVEVLIDQQRLSVVSIDDLGNLQVFLHQPKRWESLGGGRLICQSDFFMGCTGNVLTTHDILYPELAKKKTTFAPGAPAPPPPLRTRKGSNFPLQSYGSRMHKIQAPIQFYSTNKMTLQPGNQPPVDKKTCVLIGTAGGSLGLLIPLDEKMYKRLALLQELMSRTMVTVFALNPKDYRIAHTQAMHVQHPNAQTTSFLDQQSLASLSASFAYNKQAILDGVLLQRFKFLPHSLQEQLASVLGVTAYLIRENLREIDYVSRFF